MKLAVSYPSSLWSSWNMSHGVVDTLIRMGHEVTDCGFEAGSKSVSRSHYPTELELRNHDALIVLGPEHIGKYLTALYPHWSEIPVKKLAWWHESLDRIANKDEVLSLCDENFSASPEDKECHFLPFGVDTELFILTSHDSRTDTSYKPERDIEFAFIGLMYPLRQQFWNKIPEAIRSRIKVGNCTVQDLDGVNIRKSAELYAETLRRIKTLVVLPSMSKLTVTKVTEGWAAGCKVAVLQESFSEQEIRAAIENPSQATAVISLENRLTQLLEYV